MKIETFCSPLDICIGISIDLVDKYCCIFPIPCFGVIIHWDKSKQLEIMEYTDIKGPSLTPHDFETRRLIDEVSKAAYIWGCESQKPNGDPIRGLILLDGKQADLDKHLGIMDR
jgi:hypothetical protein